VWVQALMLIRFARPKSSPDWLSWLFRACCLSADRLFSRTARGRLEVFQRRVVHLASGRFNLVEAGALRWLGWPFAPINARMWEGSKPAALEGWLRLCPRAWHDL